MTAYFLAPSYALVEQGGELSVLDLLSSDELSCEGALARQTLREPALAAARLRALASIHPWLDGVATALATTKPHPWNRAALLRGAGFERLFLELTARCNERCVHCYADSSPEREEALSMEEVLSCLDGAARLGFRGVQLTGGDPLVSPLCVDAAAAAIERGLEVEVYTNGLALKGPLFEALRGLEVSLAFSFYSHDARVHDTITRTPGSHTRTLDAIRRSRAADLPTRVSVILDEENADHAEPTLQLLEQIGIARTEIGVDVVRHVGRGGTRPPLLSAPVSARGAHTGGERRQFGGTLAVLATGVVAPCIFQRDSRLGSIRQRSLEEIALDPLPVPAPHRPDAANEPGRAKRLACWDCRVRDAYLEAPALVSLGRRATT